MSSTSNITISLQTTQPGDQILINPRNSELDNEMHDDGFDKALASTINQSPTTGKELPRGPMREETAAAIERL